MKRLFATFICLFAISFCFADKVEFVADNGKEMGEIEFASENGIHLVSFTETAVIHSDSARLLQEVTMLQYRNPTNAKIMYDNIIRNVRNYSEFRLCVETIKNIPDVKAMDSTDILENGVKYRIKKIMMNQ